MSFLGIDIPPFQSSFHYGTTIETPSLVNYSAGVGKGTDIFPEELEWEEGHEQ